MKSIACLLVLVLWFGGSPRAGESDHIQWVAAEFPPFVWQQNNVTYGYAYDLIVAMSAQLGRQPDLKFYPWARAIKMTKEGPAFGVFPLARTPDRETSYKWLIQLSTIKYTFFGRRATLPGEINVALAGPEQLSTLRVGVLRGSPVTANLQARNFRHVSFEKNYQDLLRMLTMGGIDAIYAGNTTLTAAIEEFGYHQEDICAGISLDSAELYLATSPGLDSSEEHAWLKAYEVLQKDGTVARLQSKYAIAK